MSSNGTPARVVRTRRDARANYDRLARWYTWLASSEEPFRRKAIDLLDAHPGDSVLEIGCGSGTSLAALPGQGVQPVGIDLSYGMLGVARQKLSRETARRPAPLEPLLCQADGLHLPFPEGSFDGLLMTFTLELFDTPEIPQVLFECRRVLKGGGRISIASLLAPDQPGVPVRIYTWFHERLPTLVDCRPIPLQDMVEQAGFTTRENFTAAMWGLPVECILAEN